MLMQICSLALVLGRNWPAAGRANGNAAGLGGRPVRFVAGQPQALCKAVASGTLSTLSGFIAFCCASYRRDVLSRTTTANVWAVRWSA